MTTRLSWKSGGEAQVVSVGAEAIVLRSSVPSPPGSRLEGTLAAPPAAELRVKVHACKRQPDGSFEIQGRPLDLSRTVRERIAEALSREGSG